MSRSHSSPSISFDPATHAYLVDGRAFPSVTQVLGILTGDSFRYVRPDDLERARARGRDVHERINTYESGKLRQVEEGYFGYLQAWVNVKKELGLKVPTLSEVRLYSKRYGFCGTPDQVYGEILVDVKTGFGAVTQIQTAAYAQLVSESAAIIGYQHPKIKRRIEAKLMEDGRYAVREFTDLKGDFRLFLCCLSLHQFKFQKGGKTNGIAADTAF